MLLAKQVWVPLNSFVKKKYMLAYLKKLKNKLWINFFKKNFYIYIYTHIYIYIYIYST